MINHQNNFATNLTSGTSATDTTSPLNSIPTIAAPFYIAFDATNINSHYEVLLCTSKTATNVNHAALAYDHTTAEEVRMVIPATEMDSLDSGWKTIPGTLTYDSADAPTYVCTTSIDLTGSIGVGSKIKLTHAAATKYFIVTAIAAGTITLYGGTDYTLAATAITSPYYSELKSPVGFPLSPIKWTVIVTDTTLREQATAVNGTWYNLGSIAINIPIGAWAVDYKVALYHSQTTGTADMLCTLSTTNNSESDAKFSCRMFNYANAVLNTVMANGLVATASKFTFYLNAMNNNGNNAPTISFYNTPSATCVIRAICAYL